MSSINILKSLGSDSFENLFDISIPPVAGVSGTEGIQFRVTSVDIPTTPAPGQYDIHYKTIKIAKSNSKLDIDNELSFNLRVDKNWLAYKFFLEWKKLGYDQVSGVSDEDLIPKVPIIITTYDGNNNLSGGVWTFEDFYPVEISGVGFNQSGDSPIEVTIRGIHSGMDDSKIV